MVEADAAAKTLRLPRLEPPDGHRPDRDRLQRQGRRQADPHARRGRRHLQRQDHHLERPGHRRDQPGRDPAVDRRSRSSSAPTSRAPPRTSPSTSTPRPPTNWTADPAKVWSGKGEGKEKSAGVAEGVKSTDGGITYVEWSYAKDNDLSIAQVDNGGGATELTAESVGKAVEAAKADGEGNDLRLKLDYTTKEAGRLPDPPGDLRDRLLQEHGRRPRRPTSRPS